MNAREAAQVVAVIAAAYPQWPASVETVAIYADSLADLAAEETLATVRQLILVEDRWPTVATIRRAYASRLGVLAPSPSEAWGQVVEQSTIAGRNVSPSFTHPAITETVRIFGWWNLCHSTNPDTLRAQFTRMYAETQKRLDHQVLANPGQLGFHALSEPIPTVALPL
jgi:hypothetical protein